MESFHSTLSNSAINIYCLVWITLPPRCTCRTGPLQKSSSLMAEVGAGSYVADRQTRYESTLVPVCLLPVQHKCMSIFLNLFFFSICMKVVRHALSTCIDTERVLVLVKGVVKAHARLYRCRTCSTSTSTRSGSKT